MTTTDAPRWIVPFAEGDRSQRDLLGGKGANLAEMTRLGLPVPPGFIVTTEACRAYHAAGETVPEGLWDQLTPQVEALEAQAGRRLGDARDPLLVSVRSGAPFSMPGMMDTVLNLGLNDETVEGLAAATEDRRFAYDAYRRFLQLFGKVVLGVEGHRFDELLAKRVAERGARDESGLDADDVQALSGQFADLIAEVTGSPFPQDPRAQLEAAIQAVFRSWNGRRARDYRRMEGIPDDLGTAVNVQAMVFGNLGEDSGTGVAFTRNPSTGEATPYGDWLRGAQGEDVVAGIRLTRPLSELADDFPEASAELHEVFRTLEGHYRDMCDIEFTIERSRLCILQTRVGKRTAAAALQMAVDMVEEGLIDSREGVTRVTPAQLEQLLHPHFAPGAEVEVLTTGLNASPGAAVGAVVFTADDAEARAAEGERVILVRPETAPDDLHGMIAAQGILTSRGGLVSHAAVVARGMGKPAVCGAEAVAVDLEGRRFAVGETVVEEGTVISIDGSTGSVVLGEVPLEVPEPNGAFATVLGWADELRTMGVRANADVPADAAKARELGAEGIGLCRTEHMFLGDRLPVVQRMILAATEEEERAALDELLEVQRADFAALLREMDGMTVTVRLLDPPLHEFLPDVTELLVAEARGELDEQGHRLLEAAQHWQEANPMLGTRGCRLGILKPELYGMQTRALIEAAVEVHGEGIHPEVEVMVPLVVTARELALIGGWVREAAQAVVERTGVQVPYRIGTMIETPRAALRADQLAQEAEFFSFGTNDLTQMTFGFSRDDVEARIMPTYLEHHLLEVDPFTTLDPTGVGRLVRLAVEEGRAARPDLHLGVCGEHGGDPESVKLCHAIGLDYVSCSPFRVPIARLAAAHAALGVGGPGSSA
jgi:pyruvate, orthophosphate dikinase